MVRISLESLEVTSFFTETATAEGGETSPDSNDPDLCICTADISTCPRTTDPFFCCCSAEASGCHATWIHAGCDTSVGCITG
ncbi:MAG TPA: hypothetical protein VFS20_33800 [Longimicrobium sp.]|nr:hypothetical protein [Longimicrobium sp.]